MALYRPTEEASLIQHLRSESGDAVTLNITDDVQIIYAIPLPPDRIRAAIRHCPLRGAPNNLLSGDPWPGGRAARQTTPGDRSHRPLRRDSPRRGGCPSNRF